MEKTNQEVVNNTDCVGVTETQKGKAFREGNILRLFSELNNQDQEAIYSLVWSLGAKDLLYRIAKNREERMEALN